MNQNAEQNIADGAYTPAYKANVDEIIALLRRAQAREWAAFLQYWHHYFMASDIHSAGVEGLFKDHAKDEYHHAREIAERIQQLGGIPCDKPEEIARGTSTPTEYNHDLLKVTRRISSASVPRSSSITRSSASVASTTTKP